MHVVGNTSEPVELRVALGLPHALLGVDVLEGEDDLRSWLQQRHGLCEELDDERGRRVHVAAVEISREALALEEAGQRVLQLLPQVLDAWRRRLRLAQLR
eukprot:6176954-Pleurochrysis_carterae.AAC.3